MKKTNLFVVTLISLIAIFGSLFSHVPESHAQSIQGWSTPINLSNSGAASNPLLVIDGNGVFHVMWVDEFDGYKYVESTDGINWTSPKIVDFPFSPEDSAPVFIVDTEGAIHIFWRTSKNALYYAQTSQENLGLPSAWQAVVNLDTSVYDFDVALDGEGKLHIGYVKNPVPATSPSGIYYRQSINGGSSWSGTTLLYESEYFRSLTPEDTHIRIEASDGLNAGCVYIVWDDRPLKRIFLAKSNDAGLSWGAPEEISAPTASQGFKAPFNIEVNEFQDKILLMWQVGEPGIRCTLFSQSSVDGGGSWSEPTKIFDEFVACPEISKFLSLDQKYLMTLLSIQGDLTLVAWNGAEWSNPETQTGLSAMSNPVTFDAIIFRCQQASYYNNNLFVVGCDQRVGGDIWFVLRQLDPVEILFPLPSDWHLEEDVITTPQRISSLSFVTDNENNAHALWAQSPASDEDPYKPNIQYARWNGENWSRSAQIIADLNGLPVNLTIAIDNQQRLLLSWINDDTGDIMFSWASSSRANIPSEWKVPVVLPSPSNLNNSPSILVDASNRIVVAYAVTMNEERGIYLVYSNDLGETWSSPVRVFDAVSAGWESVDEPKLTLSGDGRLHILFSQFSLLGGSKPGYLYYSQSSTGGISWSEPELVSEQAVLWSSITGSNQQILHRLWKEKDKSTTVVYHQTSQDGGLTWGLPVMVSSIDRPVSEPVLTMTGSGNLHLMQLITADVPIFQEWEWAGERWRTLNARELSLKDQSLPVSISAGITSGGYLSALLLFEHDDLVDGYGSQLLNINRALESIENAQFVSTAAIIDPQVAPTNSVDSVDLQPTVTPTPLLTNLVVPPSRNTGAIGLVVLIIVSAVALLVLILPNRRKR